MEEYLNVLGPEHIYNVGKRKLEGTMTILVSESSLNNSSPVPLFPQVLTEHIGVNREYFSIQFSQQASVFCNAV